MPKFSFQSYTPSIIREILFQHCLRIILVIVAVTAARGADVRTMNDRTEGDHVLMNHTTEESVAAYVYIC